MNFLNWGIKYEFPDDGGIKSEFSDDGGVKSEWTGFMEISEIWGLLPKTLNS